MSKPKMIRVTLDLSRQSMADLATVEEAFDASGAEALRIIIRLFGETLFLAAGRQIVARRAGQADSSFTLYDVSALGGDSNFRRKTVDLKPQQYDLFRHLESASQQRTGANAMRLAISYVARMIRERQAGNALFAVGRDGTTTPLPHMMIGALAVSGGEPPVPAAKEAI